jgi:hypothetical protein
MDNPEDQETYIGQHKAHYYKMRLSVIRFLKNQKDRGWQVDSEAESEGACGGMEMPPLFPDLF